MTPEQQALAAGQRAENKVFSALAQLPRPWLSFHTVEWRLVHKVGCSRARALLYILALEGVGLG